MMKKIPYGKVITVGKIREFFAKENGADFTEPITAGIFVSIAAWASHQRLEDKTPYWRTLKANGELDENYRGNRISEQMICKASEYAKELGYEILYIMSGEKGLYEKYGFEKIGEYETIFGTVDQLFQKALI